MPPALVLPVLAMILALLPPGGWFEISSPAAATESAPTSYDAELALCVSVTNAYRASVNRGALTRAAALETYAAEAARYDANARVAHQYVKSTNFGNGLVRAENEVLWWPLANYGSVRKVVETGLAEMWREGAEGVHYRNMVGDYSEVGCGIFVDHGDVTVTQAFR